MRRRALGDAPARPAVSIPSDPPAKRAPVTSMFVAVAARRPDGGVTKLILPGPTASSRIAYLSPTADGSWITSGSVHADGTVTGGMGLGQPDPPLGARLTAVVDPRGRVLCVQEHPLRRP